MGTRSLTHVWSHEFGQEDLLCTIYRQYDGYPEGHGHDVAEFLAARQLVNGYSGDPKVFNGAGDLATQLIAHIKEPGPGNVYLTKPGDSNLGEEFVYTITAEEHRTITFKVETDEGEIIFEGDPQEFLSLMRKEGV